MANISKKAIIASRDLKHGEFIRLEDLAAIRPAANGICVENYKIVVGRRLTRDVQKDDFLSARDFA